MKPLFPPRRFGRCALLLAALALGRAQPPKPPINVPPGFEVTRVAAAPLVNFPMLGGFDDRGRLFVAENAGVNLDETALAEQKPSRVIMLEDTDGDGVFDRSTVYADKLTFPQGVQWLDGALYVASPPSIWRFEDTDGDGRADRRTEIATGFKFTGNAADVHGPFLHPNGRLYWCHGRKGHAVYQRDGTLVSQGLGARVWSCRPDGTDIQVHAGGGMDNPVELAFSQEGDIFGSANIFQGSPRTDAIIHWIHGGVYPRLDLEPVLAEFKRTGDPLPAVTELGHVAPAGLTLLRSAGFGADFAGNLMLAEFNTHRVMRVPLERAGASYRGTPEIFASSEDSGVHFTDVIEDADGSLLVINTGAWFRRGCPTSGVARPDVLGAIYRIRRTGAKPPGDPRGLAIAWPTISPKKAAELLGDPRPVVRERAVAVIAKNRVGSLTALRAAVTATDYLTRSNAVWALTRIGTPEAAAIARPALADADARVRQAACQCAFISSDQGAFVQLANLLGDESPAVCREAARALGRLHNPAATARLAEAAATSADPALMHALVYALIEIGAPEEARKLLVHPHPRARRAGLIALDQMPAGNLGADAVFTALRSSDPELRSIALSIALKHADWSREASEFLVFAFSGPKEPSRLDVGAKILSGFLRAPAVRDWLSRQFALAKPAVDLRLAVESIGGAPEAWDERWRGLLTSSLRATDAALVQSALRAIAVHRAHDFSTALAEAVHDTTRPPAFRIAALRATAGTGQTLDLESFRILIAPFDEGGTPEERLQAAAVLGAATLDRAQLIALTDRLPGAGPVELEQLLGVFQRGPTDLALAAALLSKLKETPGRFGVPGGTIQGAFRRFPEPGPADAAPLVSEVMNATVAKDSRVLELEKLTAGGDAARGRAAFLAGMGGCATCHRIGGNGGKVGPDLSHIGRIRTARDLVESIAFPSATIARGFETMRVERRDGDALTGTIQRETGDLVFVATIDGREVAVPRAAITKREPLANSLMPPGLDRALAPSALADLVAFLRSLQ